MDLAGQRRISIRHAIAESSCASSTMTCPNAQVRSAAARSAAVRYSSSSCRVGQPVRVHQVGGHQDLGVVLVRSRTMMSSTPCGVADPARRRSRSCRGPRPRGRPRRAVPPPRRAAAHRRASSRRPARAAAGRALGRGQPGRRGRRSRLRRGEQVVSSCCGVSIGHSRPIAARTSGSSRSSRAQVRRRRPHRAGSPPPSAFGAELCSATTCRSAR